MIDFSKLGRTKAAGPSQRLVDLFQQLDRKATHESLRPVQIDALGALDVQIGHRDVVLKVSTGSGKTVVGLVFAEHMRRKHPGETAVYLCPTNQ
jgi:superfamily II DNA or RNA helicase